MASATPQTTKQTNHYSTLPQNHTCIPLISLIIFPLSRPVYDGHRPFSSIHIIMTIPFHFYPQNTNSFTRRRCAREFFPPTNRLFLRQAALFSSLEGVIILKPLIGLIVIIITIPIYHNHSNHHILCVRAITPILKIASFVDSCVFCFCLREFVLVVVRFGGERKAYLCCFPRSGSDLPLSRFVAGKSKELLSSNFVGNARDSSRRCCMRVLEGVGRALCGRLYIDLELCDRAGVRTVATTFFKKDHMHSSQV